MPFSISEKRILPDSDATPNPSLPAVDKAEPESAEGDDNDGDTADVEALITSLKASLATTQTLVSSQTTRLTSLTQMEEEHLILKDRHAFAVAAREAVEKQLKEETKRREVAEENVELLRSQVEAARRGVMQLQKQEKDRRRISAMPPGAAGVGLAANQEEAEAESRSTKRSSTLRSEPVPSTTGGLRELRLGHTNTSPAAVSTSPGAHTTSFFEDLSLTGNRRASGSSMSHSNLHDSDIVAAGAAAAEEAATLRMELASMKARLSDAEEARHASETCLKALREFIASSNRPVEAEESTADLLKGIRLPPLPTDREHDEEESKQTEKKASASGWGGLRLWKGQSQPTPALSTAVEPPATPQPASSPPSTSRVKSPLSIVGGELPTESTLPSLPSTTSTPLASFVSSWTKSVTPGTPSIQVPPTNSRGLTSFFSRSISNSAKTDKELPAPPEQLEPSPNIAESGETPEEEEARIDEHVRLAAAREFEHEEVGDERRASRPSLGTFSSALKEEVGMDVSPKAGLVEVVDLGVSNGEEGGEGKVEVTA